MCVCVCKMVNMNMLQFAGCWRFFWQPYFQAAWLNSHIWFCVKLNVMLNTTQFAFIILTTNEKPVGMQLGKLLFKETHSNLLVDSRMTLNIRAIIQKLQAGREREQKDVESNASLPGRRATKVLQDKAQRTRLGGSFKPGLCLLVTRYVPVLIKYRIKQKVVIAVIL